MTRERPSLPATAEHEAEQIRQAGEALLTPALRRSLEACRRLAASMEPQLAAMRRLSEIAAKAFEEPRP